MPLVHGNLEIAMKCIRICASALFVLTLSLVVSSCGQAVLEKAPALSYLDVQTSAGCSSDDDCSADSPFCNTSTQTCVECLEDENCDEGEICVEGICIEGAAEGEGEGEGEGSCIEDKCSKEFATCMDSTECTSGLICVLGCAGSESCTSDCLASLSEESSQAQRGKY